MREEIRSFFGVIVSSYWGAFAFLIFGIWLIYFTIKHPQKDPASPLQGDMKGWAGGIGAIILAFLILYWKLRGKL